jgi:hypothetical protein
MALEEKKKKKKKKKNHLASHVSGFEGELKIIYSITGIWHKNSTSLEIN